MFSYLYYLLVSKYSWVAFLSYFRKYDFFFFKVCIYTTNGYEDTRLEPTCVLPSSWSGVWLNQQQNNQHDSSFTNYHSHSKSDSLEFKAINKDNFLNKGTCYNFKDERYFFYDKFAIHIK